MSKLVVLLRSTLDCNDDIDRDNRRKSWLTKNSLFLKNQLTKNNLSSWNLIEMQILCFQDQTPKEPETMTLEEYKAQQAKKEGPKFNLRKAGEGSTIDPKWKKAAAYKKEKENNEEEEEEDSVSLFWLISFDGYLFIFTNAVLKRAPPQKSTKVLSNQFYFRRHVSTTVFGHHQDKTSLKV